MRARVFASALVATSLLFTSAVFAAAPTTERTHFENEVVPAPGVRTNCASLGYPLPNVVNVLNGDILEKTYTNKAGVVVRYAEVAPGFTHTWLNPDNGKSVTSNQPFHYTERYYADNSLDIILSGLVYRIKVRGEGVIALNAGRLVIHIAADGTETVTVAGPEDPIFPTLCRVLSD